MWDEHLVNLIGYRHGNSGHSRWTIVVKDTSTQRIREVILIACSSLFLGKERVRVAPIPVARTRAA